MSKSKIAISKSTEFEYPNKTTLYRPSMAYPEYIWKNDLANKNNVYNQVREALYLLGYDKENYGSENWNPLGKL